MRGTVKAHAARFENRACPPAGRFSKGRLNRARLSTRTQARWCSSRNRGLQITQHGRTCAPQGEKTAGTVRGILQAELREPLSELRAQDDRSYEELACGYK